MCASVRVGRSSIPQRQHRRAPCLRNIPSRLLNVVPLQQRRVASRVERRYALVTQKHAPGAPCDANVAGFHGRRALVTLPQFGYQNNQDPVGRIRVQGLGLSAWLRGRLDKSALPRHPRQVLALPSVRTWRSVRDRAGCEGSPHAREHKPPAPHGSGLGRRT